MAFNKPEYSDYVSDNSSETLLFKSILKTETKERTEIESFLYFHRRKSDNTLATLDDQNSGGEVYFRKKPYFKSFHAFYSIPSLSYSKLTSDSFHDFNCFPIIPFSKSFFFIARTNILMVAINNPLMIVPSTCNSF